MASDVGWKADGMRACWARQSILGIQDSELSILQVALWTLLGQRESVAVG